MYYLHAIKLTRILPAMTHYLANHSQPKVGLIIRVLISEKIYLLEVLDKKIDTNK
tara:strand:- start:222 stop:386 length:165 start_codon:yes stop_codon:yes gene_type:complete